MNTTHSLKNGFSSSLNQNYDSKSKSKNNAKKSEDKISMDEREKNWDERFFLGKIPKYDAYEDVNYLSLALIKSKIRYEKKKKDESRKLQNQRVATERYSIVSQDKKNVNDLKSTLSKPTSSKYHLKSLQTTQENEKSALKSSGVFYISKLNSFAALKTPALTSANLNSNNTFKSTNSTGMIGYKFPASKKSGDLNSGSRTNNRDNLTSEEDKELELPADSPFLSDESLKKEFYEMNDMWHELGVKDY